MFRETLLTLLSRMGYTIHGACCTRFHRDGSRWDTKRVTGDDENDT